MHIVDGIGDVKGLVRENIPKRKDGDKMQSKTRVWDGQEVSARGALNGPEQGRQRADDAGDLEADLKHRRISISSPIARALIGKHEGDAITIQAPGGDREYEIAAVRYID